MTSLLAFTARGAALARRLAGELVGQAFAPARFAAELEGVLPLAVSASDWAGQRFEQGDNLLFVGAAGIAVRSCAPHLRSKDRDPAVLVVDEAGRYVIPLLCGHIGGANRLAERVAGLLGAQAVITTATDVSGVFAFDEWAARSDCAVANPGAIKTVSAALLAGERVGLRSDFPVEGPLPPGVEAAGAQRCGALISLRAGQPFEHTLRIIPRCLVLGVGCRRGIAPERLEAALAEFLVRHNLPEAGIGRIASIDRKRDEPAIHALARRLGIPFETWPADQLAAAEGEFTASGFVRDTVGVDNVCERAAVRAGGELIAAKTAIGPVALAAARLPWVARLSPECRDEMGDKRMGDAKLYVVGLGPGRREEMTPRALRAIERCEVAAGYGPYLDWISDLIVDKEVVRTGMRGEVARCRAAVECARGGKLTCLVCGGDPGVYGMAGLALELAGELAPDLPVEIIPGVTAATAGAAVAGAPIGHDFAVVSLSDLLTEQSLIERRLRAAAAAGFVLCLYNPGSRGRTGQLRRACEIALEHLAPETPCALVRAAGRPEESCELLRLDALREASADMSTVVLVGSADTRIIAGRLVTPRGYRL